ncbi:MAG TPA: TonB-dependent receptor, partial [Novosphingobium sp.]|nr:TonB-dependent receptor [Novosphingobium sp.]
MATPVFAQSGDGAGQELVVTARRVNEKLSDVPASVSVLNAAMIEKSGIAKADDFVKLTPGVTIVAGPTEAADVQINIRGINNARDAEGSVALVVDGILKTNTAALNQAQGVMTQIEVLKGPQGAIYGRNATAGAIVIQTRKPTDTLMAGITASYATQNTARGQAWLSGPLADGVGFVLSGDYYTTDGFYRNTYLGGAKLVDNQHSWNINGRILADLGPDTTLDTKARYGRLSGASLAYNAAFNLPAFAQGTGISTYNENVNSHPFSFYNNIVPRNEQKTLELSTKLTHEFSGATLSAWVAFNDTRNWLLGDGTSADFALFTSPANSAVAKAASACNASVAALQGYPTSSPTYIGATPGASLFGPYSPTTCDGSQYQRRTQQDISGEIRLASKAGAGYNWQLGAYYIHVNRRAIVSSEADTGQQALAQAYSGPDTISPTNQMFDDTFHTDAYAPFAAGDYNVTKAFNVGIALRYDVEQRHVSNNVPLVLDPFSGHCLNPGQGLGSVCTPISDKQRTFQMFEPKVTLRYRFGPEATVYANWGVGFKSGGFNNQGAAAIVASAFGGIGSEARIEDVYKPERTSSFEAGVKGRIGPVDYTLAGYYTRVRNMQFFEFFVGSFALLRVVENIDRVDIKGLEGSLNWRVMKGWTLGGSFNVIDSKIKANSVRPSTVGNKSPYTADYTVNVSTQYETPVTSHLNLLLKADYRLTGPTWFHVVQAQSNPTIFGVP